VLAVGLDTHIMHLPIMVAESSMIHAVSFSPCSNKPQKPVEVQHSFMGSFLVEHQ